MSEPTPARRWATFKKGIRSMTWLGEFRPYHWVIPLGPLVFGALVIAGFGAGAWVPLVMLLPISLVIHFDRPSPGDRWWAFHFSEVAVVSGLAWVGIKDTD